MATPDTARPVRGPTGWALFAAVLMIIVGWLNFCYGLAAVLNDDVVVVGGHGAIIADITAWGWVTLILGLILVLVGLGMFAEAGPARGAGVFIVGLNAIAQVWIFPAAPLWAFIVILLDVIVIYNLTVRWGEPA
jgi:hypothetical protein